MGSNENFFHCFPLTAFSFTFSSFYKASFVSNDALVRPRSLVKQRKSGNSWRNLLPPVKMESALIPRARRKTPKSSLAAWSPKPTTKQSKPSLRTCTAKSFPLSVESTNTQKCPGNLKRLITTAQIWNSDRSPSWRWKMKIWRVSSIHNILARREKITLLSAKCVKEKWHTIDDKQVECKSAVDNYQYKQQRNFHYQNNYRYDCKFPWKRYLNLDSKFTNWIEHHRKLHPHLHSVRSPQWL